MNYQLFSDELLVNKLQESVGEERKMTAVILQLLHEVEIRLLFAELGYSSLYEFCVKHLGYCEGSAHLRISSMRLLKTLPTKEKELTEKKLESGELSLSNLSLVQNFIRKDQKMSGEPIELETKLELISEVSSKSKREAEKILLERNPDVTLQTKEKIILLPQEKTQLTLVIDAPLASKLRRAKELCAHTQAVVSYSEILEMMTDFYLKHKDPSQKAGRNLNKEKPNSMVTAPRSSNEKSTFPERSESVQILTSSRSRFIPAQIKHAVWSRDQSRCSYVNLSENRACLSTFGLELDHVTPYAKGGRNTVENLRLRCRAHNSLHALKTYGQVYRKVS